MSSAASCPASGPIIEQWPPAAVTAIFTRGLAAPPTSDYAEEIVHRFMTRACAGTCTAAMEKPYVGLIMSRFEECKDFVAAVKFGLSAALCSPLSSIWMRRSARTRRVGGR